MSGNMERAQTASETTDGYTPHRGVQLPPIQTTFQKPPQRLQRPRPVQQVIIAKDCQSMPPVEHVALVRRPSKSGIFGLFGRNKSYRTTKPQATSETIGEGEEKEKAIGNTVGGQTIPKSKEAGSTVEGSFLSQDINVIPGVQRESSSPVKQRPVRGTSRSKSLRKESTTWDPPPLFQAYPQAIKHSLLSAPTASADAILRHYDTNKSAPPNDDAQGCSQQDSEKKGRATNKRHRSNDATVSRPWEQKIYVLVTSGYILQYAGDGSFDRLPEKTLPLGKDSAAFASDVIPGKPWVLRVCHEFLDNEGAHTSQGPNFVFKKFAFRNETRRPASNFLLVIDSPEEMNEWLVAVRKEIEALGGKQYCPDFPCRRTSSEVRRTLNENPSRRFLIKRDPNRFGDPPWGPVPAITSHSGAVPPEPGLNDPDRRPSDATRKSVDSPSVCNTTVSTEQGNLDRLRETPRISYASNAKTWSTSPASSPSQSPKHATSELSENVNIEPSNDCITPKAQRASTLVSSWPLMTQRKSSDTSNPRPASNYIQSGLPEATSPPHFSVPCYSKRYSVANNHISRMASPMTARSSTIQESDLMPSDPEKEDQRNHRTSVLGVLQPTPRTSPKGSKSLGNLSAYFGPPPPTIPFASDTILDELVYPNSDAAVPRRFSSLAYSRGISPIRETSNNPPSPSPHPPPTTALPVIPGTSSILLTPGSHRHSALPFVSPAKQANSSRRPVSIQVRTRPTAKMNEDTVDIVSNRAYQADISTTSSASPMMPELISADCNPSSAMIPAPPTRSAPSPPQGPEIQTVKSLSHVQGAPREGLTHLPRLPPIRVSQKDFQGSLEGPWSAEYDSERTHGVRAS